MRTGADRPRPRAGYRPAGCRRPAAGRRPDTPAGAPPAPPGAAAQADGQERAPAVPCRPPRRVPPPLTPTITSSPGWRPLRICVSRSSLAPVWTRTGSRLALTHDQDKARRRPWADRRLGGCRLRRCRGSGLARVPAVRPGLRIGRLRRFRRRAGLGSTRASGFAAAAVLGRAPGAADRPAMRRRRWPRSAPAPRRPPAG